MNKTKYTFSTLLLILTGTILLIAYIWHRFLRERLPKNIPFHLTEYSCIILIAICCMYIFTIITLVIEFKANNNAYITFLINGLYKPLKTLDEAIKTIAIINYYYKKLILVFINKITKDYIKKIYYLSNIWPRIFLLAILCFDIVYFHKLENIYKIILISLIPLLYKYMIYSFKEAKQQYILLLETKIEKVMTDYQEESNNEGWNFLSVSDFVDIQANSIFLNDHKFHCNPLPNISDTKKIIEDKGDLKKTRLEYTSMLNSVINLSVQIQWFTFYHGYDDSIKYIKVVIFSTYLMCWTYILFVSMPFLPTDAFSWLWMAQDIQDPFSLTNLSNHDN